MQWGKISSEESLQYLCIFVFTRQISIIHIIYTTMIILKNFFLKTQNAYVNINIFACSFRNTFKPMCKTFHIDVESAQCPLETSRVRAPAIRWNSTACICLDFLPLKNEKSWGKPQCKRIFQINKIVWINSYVTVPIDKILSVINARAWVSMVSYLKK